MKIQTVSVGIPAYNEQANMGALLRNLLAQKTQGFRLDRIFVVNDRSTDRTAGEVRSVHSKHIVLIENRRRLGQALSQNKVLEANTSDLLILINADVLPVGDRFLEHMVAAARKDRRHLGILGARIVPVPPTTAFERIMVYGINLRMRIALQWRSGDNIYTAIGAARAFTKPFAAIFRFPAVQTEDVYAYMYATTHGYAYRYNRQAGVYLKLPDNLADHIKQSRRFVDSQQEIEAHFTASEVKNTYDIPLRTIARYFFEGLFQHPFLLLGYSAVVVYTRLLRPQTSTTPTWDTVSSSKKLTLKKAIRDILIPNATGPANIGDQAILVPLIRLLRQEFPKSTITVHSNFPYRYRTPPGDALHHTLYSYAVFDNAHPFVRTTRVLCLIVLYLLAISGIELPIGDTTLRSRIRDYQNADLIVFPGGGYLRSKPGITQILNILMQLLMIDLATRSRGRTLMAPISFGPFAQNWLARLSAKVLSSIDTVTVRESYSYKKLLSYGLTNVRLSTDHALFITKNPKLKQPAKVIGFTIRHWLREDARQAAFESAFASAIGRFAKESHFTVQPIIQVSAPGYGNEEDTAITARIVKQLQRYTTHIRPTKVLSGLDDAIDTYGSLTMLLGMRMHSNIVAVTQGVPYTAIAYEYKTQGIADVLGHGRYVLPVDSANEADMYAQLTTLYRELPTVRQSLAHNLKKLVDRETKAWKELLHD